MEFCERYLSQDLSSFKNLIFKIDFAGMQSISYLLCCSFLFYFSVKYYFEAFCILFSFNSFSSVKLTPVCYI